MALLSPHCSDEAQCMDPVRHNLIFEGFLKKRKDTMKFTWAKYWFKLQNTTLYFYTSKGAQPANLRGQYYMYSVQSVRSVTSPDGDFPFEIVMKNGKKKLLSADSEDLRDVWIKLLWKSMQLPGPGHSSSSCTWYDIPGIIQRGISVSDWTPRDDVLNSPPESAPQGSSSLTFEFNLLTSCQADPSESEGDTNSASLFSIYDFPTSRTSSSTAPAAAPDASPPTSPDFSCDPALGQDRTKIFSTARSEGDTNSDSLFSIYDFPTSRTSSSTAPAAAPDASPPASPAFSCGERPSSLDPALGQNRTKTFSTAKSEGDTNSDSLFSIYDFPTSRTSSSTAPAAAPDISPPTSPVFSYGDDGFSSHDAALGQDYMTMEKLSLCDSPALDEDEDCGSGVEAQYMLMADVDVAHTD